MGSSRETRHPDAERRARLEQRGAGVLQLAAGPLLAVVAEVNDPEALLLAWWSGRLPSQAELRRAVRLSGRPLRLGPGMTGSALPETWPPLPAEAPPFFTQVLHFLGQTRGLAQQKACADLFRRSLPGHESWRLAWALGCHALLFSIAADEPPIAPAEAKSLMDAWPRIREVFVPASGQIGLRQIRRLADRFGQMFDVLPELARHLGEGLREDELEALFEKQEYFEAGHLDLGLPELRRWLAGQPEDNVDSTKGEPQESGDEPLAKPAANWRDEIEREKEAIHFYCAALGFPATATPGPRLGPEALAFRARELGDPAAALTATTEAVARDEIHVGFLLAHGQGRALADRATFHSDLGEALLATWARLDSPHAALRAGLGAPGSVIDWGRCMPPSLELARILLEVAKRNPSHWHGVPAERALRALPDVLAALPPAQQFEILARLENLLGRWPFRLTGEPGLEEALRERLDLALLSGYADRPVALRRWTRVLAGALGSWAQRAARGVEAFLDRTGKAAPPARKRSARDGGFAEVVLRWQLAHPDGDAPAPSAVLGALRGLRRADAIFLTPARLLRLARDPELRGALVFGIHHLGESLRLRWENLVLAVPVGEREPLLVLLLELIRDCEVKDRLLPDGEALFAQLLPRLLPEAGFSPAMRALRAHGSQRRLAAFLAIVREEIAGGGFDPAAIRRHLRAHGGGEALLWLASLLGPIEGWPPEPPQRRLD